MENVKSNKENAAQVQTTSQRADVAAGYFKEGYNCAQSVFLAFLDKTEFDKDTALRLASSFGGGIGRLREVCGAVSAMFMVAGLLKGYNSPNDDTAKAKHYALIQELANEFRVKHGSIICRELLGFQNSVSASANLSKEAVNVDENIASDENFSPIPLKRTEEYYAKRPCEDFIKTAAEIIEKRVL